MTGRMIAIWMSAWAGISIAQEPVVLTVGPAAQHTSIQAAIDAAPDGAVVRISEGTYEERLTIRKPVRLEGAGWDRTVIIGHQPSPDEFQRKILARPNDEPALLVQLRDELRNPTIRIEDTHEVELTGLKITSQPIYAPGSDSLGPQTLLLLSRAEVEVSDCGILGSPGSCIEVRDGSDLRLHNSLVAAGWNTGIVVGERDTDASRATITDCDVRNFYYAGIVVHPGQEASVERCWVSGAAWHGIRYDDASPVIRGNRISANARSGIYASGKTAATIESNLLLGNEMCGMSCWYENNDTISGNTFSGNLREGLAVLGRSRPLVRNNIFLKEKTAVLCSGVQGKDREAMAIGAPRPENNLFRDNDVKLVQRGTQNPPNAAPQPEGPSYDPQFVNAPEGDYRLALDSPARRDRVGTADPLPPSSRWPLQPEERAMIPDGATRDSRQWKTR